MASFIKGVPYRDCLRVAEKFSEENLKAHPRTENVMQLCSNDCVFVGRCIRNWVPYYVGRSVATIGYRYLCQNSVIECKPNPEVKLNLGKDHIIWEFNSVQLRKSLFPWLFAPSWYHIESKSKLYFKKTEQGVMISRYENEYTTWTSCDQAKS